MNVAIANVPTSPYLESERHVMLQQPVPSPLPPESQSDQHDLTREVQATLAARHELGPEYDDQFIQRLVERLTAQVRQEVARAPRARASGLAPDQRTGVAICSLIFGIPLVAIAGGIAGPVGLAVAFVALVLINIAAGMSW
jgi:hypothetical protein